MNFISQLISTTKGNLMTVAFTESQACEFVEAQFPLPIVTLGQFIKTENLSCVDGREEFPVIGTAGGSMGIFLESLASLEKVTGERLNTREVTQFFKWYVTTLGKFYMHTDTHALSQVVQSLKEDSDFMLEEEITQSLVISWIINPSLSVGHQMILLEHLLSASHMGCGHLSRMVRNPDQYRMRAELVKDAIRAYFMTLWYDENGARDLLVYHTLEHHHAEQSVIQVMVDVSEVTMDTRFPLVIPHYRDIQNFVQHPQVEIAVRNAVAKKIAYESDFATQLTDPQRFVVAMNKIGDDVLRETLSHLALGKLIHEYTLPADWWKHTNS